MKEDMNKLIPIIIKGVGLAMGIAVIVLNIMNQISVKDSILMLAIGFACASIASFREEKK